MEQKQETVLEWYRKKKKIDAPCGGRGDCGRCKIRFSGKAPEAGVQEKRILSEEEIKKGIRLACMTEKTEEMQESDFVLSGDIFYDSEMCFEGEIASLIKQQNGQNTEAVPEQEFGIALDIGTTTLAMRLIGLKTGEAIATITAMNHQRAYGADVITRIKAANEGKLKELQRCILKDIGDMLIELLQVTGINFSWVKKIIIAGNTTMCHLLLGYSCEGLGKAPFRPVDIGLTQTTIQKLFESYEECDLQKLWGDSDAEVTILPGISAFVGADIVAGIYYCDMDINDTPQMLLDIGTNGEIVNGSNKGFVVSSAAAGPVFEGGNISCGMPAVKGAIAHIKKNVCEVIGATEPKGICGSGLVDLATYLLDTQVIDENGTLCDAYFDEGYPLAVCMNKNATEGTIRLTQADIRQLQMGKAAIRAGVEALADTCEPEKVYLAGGFGVAMDVTSAVKTDLLPKRWCERIESVGNAALEGAHKFLLAEDGAERVKSIVEKSKEILLAEDGKFEETYIHFMQFLI